jgi:uncharacterized protein
MRVWRGLSVVVGLMLMLHAGAAQADWLVDAAAAHARGDFQAEISVLKPPAEQGDAFAQFAVGVMCVTGLGVAQNYAAAVEWYRRAALQGHVAAQYALAMMYDNGEGVAKDYVKAHALSNMAAANGDNFAARNRDIIATRMTPDQIAQAQALASICMAQNYKDCDI